MTLCINPNCSYPHNPDTTLFCSSCGTDLLLDGQYRVIQKLGGGGFGLTYEVDHKGTAKVLKLLHLDDDKAILLFQQEAEVLAKLHHSGIPNVEPDAYFTVIPKGSNEPLHCLVMEKIIGEDLSKWLQKRGQPISQKNALDWLKQLAEILDVVHSQNFFHRDIKPPNIMLRANGQLVLIDFGTVREVTASYLAKQQAGNKGTVIYSLGYAPDEQMLGKTVPQSDFFALGRTFVHLLTGQHPLNFVSNNGFNWRYAVPNLSPILADFLDELMGERPEHRPANTKVILQRLDGIERQLKQPPKVPQNQPQIIHKNPQPAVTQPQQPVIPNINPSPAGLPVKVTPKPPVKAQPVKNNKLRNGLIAIGGVLLLGIGITQGYGYLKYKKFPTIPQLLISDLLSSFFLDKTLIGHSGSVESVNYSPDGRYLASGSSDKTIKIWDVPTGKEVSTFTGHSDSVESVDYSPDGHYLASGSNDKTIIIWNIATGQQLHTLTDLTGHSDSVKSVNYSPDGRYLASGNSDTYIKIWDVVAGKELRTITGQSGYILSVNYSPDEHYLASGSYNKTIKIWDVATGKQLHSLTVHSSYVTSVAYSPDGRYLASGSDDKTIKIWDVATEKQLHTLTGHSESVRSVAYSPDGRYLASGSWDNTIKIWDVETGKEVRTLTGHSDLVNSVAYSPDGRYLASGSLDKTIKIWRVGR